MASNTVPLPRKVAPNFDRSHMVTSTPRNCLACGKPLPIPHSIAMVFCPTCSADPARTVKAETGRYPRRSDTLRSGVKVDRLVHDFKRHGSIRRIAKDYGITRKHATTLLRRKGCVTDQRRLKAAAKRDRIIQAFREHPSVKWVSKSTRSSANYVRAVVHAAGFETSKVQRKIADWKLIIDLYRAGLSTIDLAKKFNVQDESIRRGLKRRGEAMRPRAVYLKQRRGLLAIGRAVKNIGESLKEAQLRQMLAIYFKLYPTAEDRDAQKIFKASPSTIGRARTAAGAAREAHRPKSA